MINRFTLSLLASLFICLTAVNAEPAPVEDKDTKNIEAAINNAMMNFELESVKIGKNSDALNSLLDNIEAEFAKVSQTQAKKPTIEAKKPTIEAKPPGVVVKALSPSLSSELRQKRELIKYAQAERKMAEKAMARAKAAATPEEAHIHLKDAQQRMRKANKVIERVKYDLKPNVSVPQTKNGSAQKSNINLPKTWSSLEQLKNSAGFGKEYYGRLGFGERQDYGADPVGFKPASSMLELGDGKNVDLGTLKQVLNSVVPDTADEPMFNQVTLPGSGKIVYQPSKKLLEAVSSPETRKKMGDVGGIALEVTFDALALAGVPGFRKEGPASVIDTPVIISLVELYKQVANYTDDQKNGDRLPEELRYPGGIERIYGFVLDRFNQDIFLVGSRAQMSETRIDISDLIVGINTVWSRGETPGVSLDPDPKEPGGPQYSRIIAVPDNSHFAKVMLDADYTMKRMILGNLEVDTAKFRSFLDIYRGKPRLDRKAKSTRFWLSPMPLAADNVHISTTDRTVLFESRVRCQTEEMRSSERGHNVGTGEVGESEKKLTDSFTRSYDWFERNTAIEPKGIFMQLHGLVDIVILAKLLRQMGVGYPVLEAFSRLPVDRLTGSETVPSYYPGVTVVYATSPIDKNFVKEHFISGGVMMRVRARRRSIDRYQDATTAILEYMVDRFRRDGDFVQMVNITFSIPRPDPETSGPIEQKVTVGRLLLSAGKYEAAREELASATKADPMLSEAWVYLALAESALGNDEAAISAVEQALRLEPSDLDFQNIALIVMESADPDLDLSGWDELVRRDFSLEYSLHALVARFNGFDVRSKELANKALRLWEDNPDAYVVRADASWDTMDEAIRDYDRAIRLYRKQVRNTRNGQKLLASALISRGRLRMGEFADLSEEDHFNPSIQHFVFQVLKMAIEEVAEARQIDPGQPRALTVEAGLRSQLVVWQNAAGQSHSLALDQARNLVDEVVERFPDYAPGYGVRAYILTLQGDKLGAIKAATEAIRLNPTSHRELASRAVLYTMVGNCEAARADLRRTKGDGVSDPELEELVRECK